MWKQVREVNNMNKVLSVILSVFTFLLGALGGAFGVVYAKMPETEDLIVGEEVFYSYNGTQEVSTVPLTGEAGELSVHFLEMGNKYTGDCTYIRYGTTDILIDCGSKSSSIPYVSEYLKKHMQDNVIEYCIVTHAHADHYAGFATNSKTKSLFEIFEFGTIIDFGSHTNKGKTVATATGMQKNYLTKRAVAIENGAEYYDASTQVKNSNKVYNIGENNEVKLEILYNGSFASGVNNSENNYSVCSLLTYDNKEFLFTGDLEEAHGSYGETRLLDDNLSLQTIKNNGETHGVEVFKAGHHGSKTSNSQAFMEAMRPEYVCVCCCAGSSEYTDTINNQFPTQEFINVIAQFTDKVFVTTLCVDYDNNEFTSMNGNIVVITNVCVPIGINCSNNNTILKDTEWFNRIIDDGGTSRPMRVWPSGS